MEIMMETRIDPETVLDAYRQLGARPLVGDWIRTARGSLLCCPLTAVWLASQTDPPVVQTLVRHFGIDDPYGQESICQQLGISIPYHDGFLTGYDGGDQPPEWSEPSWEGFLDGREVFNAVLRHQGARLARITKRLLTRAGGVVNFSP